MSTAQNIQTIAFVLAPLLLPKVLAFYRSIRYAAPSKIRPATRATSYALTILFVSALASLLSTLPLFYAENIFQVTQSRLGTVPGVLFSRLNTLRPLSTHDTALLESFNAYGLDAKLTYLKFGPDVLLYNPLVTSPSDVDAERYNVLYTLPTILFPHLLHLGLLGLITSPFFLGSPTLSAKWRPYAIAPALALPAWEIYYLATTTTHAQNRQSTRVSDMQPLFWRLPVYRGLGLAVTDATLGYVLWLASTGRAFASPVPVGERLLGLSRNLEGSIIMLKKIGVVRNGSVRDAQLRGRVDGYWRKEHEVMRSVMEEPEVLDAQRGALKRMDHMKVRKDVEAFVDSIGERSAGLG